MKIAEITVGTEYGATDGKRRTSYGKLPRRVTALEIVTVPEEYWEGGGYTSRRATKNVRKVKVRLEGKPGIAGRRTWDEPVYTGEEGAVVTVEAKHLIAPWSELHKDVQKKIDSEQRQADAKAATEARILALIGKESMDDVSSYVTVHEYHGSRTPLLLTEARLSDDELERILALAEVGLHLENAGKIKRPKAS